MRRRLLMTFRLRWRRRESSGSWNGLKGMETEFAAWGQRETGAIGEGN